MALAERKSIIRKQQNNLIDEVIVTAKSLTKDGMPLGKYRSSEFRADSTKFVAVNMLLKKPRMLSRALYGTPPVAVINVTDEIGDLRLNTQYNVYEKAGIRKKGVEIRTHIEHPDDENIENKGLFRKTEKIYSATQKLNLAGLKSLADDLKNVI